MKQLLIIFSFFVLFVSAKAQMPSIGTIDFYGLHTISENQVREKLGLKEGDAMISSKAEQNEIEKRLVSLPNVVGAQFNAVCCTDEQKTMLYIGIREKKSPALEFRPAPNGSIRLSDEIVKLGKDFAEAHYQAVLKGDVADDASSGHSLMKNAEARAVQEKFIPIANENLNLLRRVLRESSDAEQRALAAQIVAYYRDKAAIVNDLVYAMKDFDSTVRNNAMRALGLIANYGFAHPDKNIKVPFKPFVEMLNSMEWTDRNKSSMALAELTKRRDAALLTLLRQKAVSLLLEMARWKNAGHAGAPFIILGRIAGFADEEIVRILLAGKREELILKAQERLSRAKNEFDKR